MTDKILEIYRGVPGSGKSTEAVKYTKAGNAIRVNRDDIRFSKFGVYWGCDEQLVNKFFEADLRTALGTGMRVISDNTNLVAKHVKRQMQLAQEHGYEVQFCDFPISKNEALERDANREKKVGYDVIDRFFTRFVGKNGLDLPPVPMLTPTPTFEPYEAPGPGFPHAVLVDIDGTLAHMTNRGPYDTSRYADDDFDQTIAYIVESVERNHAQSCHIIVMSGRDEAFRDVTHKWLKDFDFLFDSLYMRPEGDLRNDAIVKNELFEKYIAGRYNVDFVLDDRDRVVKMWRAKGLKVLQVADGDF